jgi:undecaprenyl-diphosphatase
VAALIAASARPLPADASWFRDVNAFAGATSWLHEPMRLYAGFGAVLFAVLLLAGWWVARGSRDLPRVAAACWAPLGTLLAVGANQPIVHGVHEARPYTTMPHVLVLVARTATTRSRATMR